MDTFIDFPKFSSDEIKEAFDCFDINSNGQITTEELKYIFKTLGEETNDEELDEMIRLADKDQSGSVNWFSFYEFITGLVIICSNLDI